MLLPMYIVLSSMCHLQPSTFLQFHCQKEFRTLKILLTSTNNNFVTSSIYNLLGSFRQIKILVEFNAHGFSRSFKRILKQEVFMYICNPVNDMDITLPCCPSTLSALLLQEDVEDLVVCQVGDCMMIGEELLLLG